MRLYPGVFWFVLWWVVLPAVAVASVGPWWAALYVLCQLAVFVLLVYRMAAREGERLWETNAP
jgi:hypothetical protein